MLEVEVPFGMVGGDQLTVQTADGAQFEVTIPDGLEGGSTFLVNVEATAEPSSVCMEVVVPDGVGEGDSFSMQLPTDDGERFVDVVVPSGVSSGETITVEVPNSDMPQMLAKEQQRQPPPPPQEPRQGSQPCSSSSMAPLLESLPHLPAAAARSPSPIAPSSPPATAVGGHQNDHPIPQSSPSTRSGGSRFGDRFGQSGGAKQTQPHFAAGGWLATGGRADSPGMSPVASPSRRAPAAPEVLLCRTDALRVPRAEAGCRFFKGQFVQILRSSGEWCNGVVIELMPHGFETLYRCRLGEGILEKLLSEDELREPVPDEGFQYCRGQVMQVERPTGLLELATITGCKLDKSRHRPEPWYTCRMHVSATTPTSVSETVHEEDLRVPTPQAGCAYYVGQLLQAKRSDGSWNTLVRVVAFEMVGYSLGYRCHVEDALTRGASW